MLLLFPLTLYILFFEAQLDFTLILLVQQNSPIADKDNFQKDYIYEKPTTPDCGTMQLLLLSNQKKV